MATINGKPSVPARTNDSGVPPTPSQMGSCACAGRRPKLALPANFLRVPNGQQQAQLFAKQLVVVIEAEAKKRKRLGRRAAPHYHFGPALRNQIQRGKLLKHAHRVGGAQHRHGASQADALGARRSSRQNYGRGRVEVFGAVVLTDTKYVEPHLVGALNPFEQQAHGLRTAQVVAPVLEQMRGKTIDSNFHRARLRQALREQGQNGYPALRNKCTYI
jgi:hypothetical protein